MRLNPSRPVY